MSAHDESRANNPTIRAEPVIRGIMSRLAVIGLTALETWSSSDIPTPDQVETGRDVFKCILDSLAWEATKRNWEVLSEPEQQTEDIVSRETEQEEEEW